MRKPAIFLLSTTLTAALAVSQLEAQPKVFDPTNFILVGGGLGAGMADFSLKDIYQKKNFGAQIAQQLNTLFPQPLIEGSGIGNAPGFPALPVRYPGPGQGAVREDFPPQLFVFNLSMPGYRITDTVGRRPGAPIIRQNDMQETVANLVLGYPSLVLYNKPLWTQFEYAQQMNPTFAIVELGYDDVLSAAATGDLTQLPNTSTFATTYSQVVSTLAANGATVMVMTVPDPTNTAYFTNLAGITRLTGAPSATISSLYKINSGDLITVNGVTAMAVQLEGSTTAPLPANSVLPAASVAQIQAAVKNLNSQITTIAQKSGAIVFDLNALLANVQANGVMAGTQLVTANYLGGFYSLDGYYPGETGHALIANSVLTQLNSTFGTSYQLLSLADIAANDPSVRYATQVENAIR
jgi:hypothetical protein